MAVCPVCGYRSLRAVRCYQCGCFMRAGFGGEV